MPKIKVCSKCGQAKPLTDEFFNRRPGRESKDGFRNECKECLAEYRRRYYEANKQRIVEVNTAYRKNNWEAFTQRRRRYEEHNRERLAEWRKSYYARNKERIAEWRRKHVAENRERYTRYYREWARANPDKCKEKRHRREAKQKNLAATLTTEQWDRALRHFGNRCAYCGTEGDLQQEHFIPLSKGGEYTRSNIIPACKSCNCSKMDTDFFEWYPKQKHYSKQREERILRYLNYDHNRERHMRLSIL